MKVKSINQYIDAYIEMKPINKYLVIAFDFDCVIVDLKTIFRRNKLCIELI